MVIFPRLGLPKLPRRQRLRGPRRGGLALRLEGRGAVPGLGAQGAAPAAGAVDWCRGAPGASFFRLLVEESYFLGV